MVHWDGGLNEWKPPCLSNPKTTALQPTSPPTSHVRCCQECHKCQRRLSGRLHLGQQNHSPKRLGLFKYWRLWTLDMSTLNLVMSSLCFQAKWLVSAKSGWPRIKWPFCHTASSASVLPCTSRFRDSLAFHLSTKTPPAMERWDPCHSSLANGDPACNQQNS